MMAIDYQREDYDKALPEWELIDKVVDEVDLGTLLPELNAHDVSAENKTRNDFYKERASWFGGSTVTVQGLIGVAFEDAPEIDLPAQLEYLIENADGSGLDLQQQMQDVTGEVIRKGRAGMFVTYPEREGDASVADQQAGNAVSTIHMIDAKRIINWWDVTDGANIKLGGVIFTDSETVIVEYEHKITPTIRELALEEGAFVDRTWHKPKDSDKWVVLRESMPVDGAGNRWTEIPFTFVGAQNNTAKMDRPPMLSLARLNRDHYRNSADHEESVWYAGQAQPYLDTADSGMANDDLKKAAADGFYIGSRQLILGKLGFAQADPNSATRQAMLDKMGMMKALGARFLEPGTVAKTATESAGEQKLHHSILSLVMSNIEDAYNAALRFVAQYMNSEEGEVTFSRDFMNPAVTVEMIDRVVSLLDRAAVGFADILPVLKRAKLVDAEKTVEEYVEEVNERGGLVQAIDAQIT